MDSITEKKDAVPPVLRMPFRILFLATAAFSVAAIGIWTLSLAGQLSISPYGSVVWWHSHEMLFGVTSAVIVGFLNTAVQTWTGERAIYGYPLLALALLWLAARLLLIFPILPDELIALLDISFIPAMAYVLVLRLLPSKQKRNLLFLPLLLVLTLANIASHYSVLTQQPNMDIANIIAVYTILTVISIVGGRVIPFFTSRALNIAEKPRWLWLEISASVAMLLLLLAHLFSFPHPLAIMITATAFGLQFTRFTRWHSIKTLQSPILWSLHLGYLWIIIGLALELLSYVQTEISRSIYWHAYALGGMGILVLSMMSRVSLGHSGRPLIFHWAIPFACLSLLVAVLARVLVVWLVPQIADLAYAIAGISWCIGFGIFFIIYYPLLMREEEAH